MVRAHGYDEGQVERLVQECITEVGAFFKPAQERGIRLRVGIQLDLEKLILNSCVIAILDTINGCSRYTGQRSEGEAPYSLERNNISTVLYRYQTAGTQDENRDVFGHLGTE